jgi:hypothetical protein
MFAAIGRPLSAYPTNHVILAHVSAFSESKHLPSRTNRSFSSLPYSPMAQMKAFATFGGFAECCSETTYVEIGDPKFAALGHSNSEGILQETGDD